LKEVAESYPGLDIVLSSGYSEQMVSESRSNLSFRGFLKKPYSMRELKKMMEVMTVSGSQ